MNGFSHSHYSVPGMFFHHHLPCCSPASFDHPQLAAAGGQGGGGGAGSSNGYPEDHYESASICYGSPAASAGAMASTASSHGNGTRVAGLKPRNYPRPKGGN